MKILITGATGFIGLEVTQQLARFHDDVEPIAMVRRIERAPLVNRLGVETVFADLESPSAIRRAVDGVDAVIHLAGRATFEAYDVVAPTIVDGAELVVRSAVDAGVGSVILGSSAFVYGGGQPVDASTEPDPVIDYGRAKLDAEHRCSDVAAGSHTAVGALRLPHVFGPHSLLFGLVRRGVVPFPGDGTNRFAQLHVADAAAALIAAARQRWAGRAAVAADSPTWNEFFAVLTESAPRIRVIRFPMRPALAGARLVGPLLSRLAPTMVSADTIRGWNLDLAVEDRSVWKELGLDPALASIEQSVPATLDGCVALRWRHPLFDFA